MEAGEGVPQVLVWGFSLLGKKTLVGAGVFSKIGNEQSNQGARRMTAAG
jgi:hypothetical protein